MRGLKPNTFILVLSMLMILFAMLVLIVTLERSGLLTLSFPVALLTALKSLSPQIFYMLQIQNAAAF
jgi:hypothetical protein